jgi:hypothetical protein
MSQLEDFDRRITSPIVLLQGVEEPFHLPFDFRCVGVHVALPDGASEPKAGYHTRTKVGKLPLAYSYAQESAFLGRGRRETSRATKMAGDRSPDMDLHSANPGDRLKHALLLEILEGTHDWPDVTYAETHAGSGI